MKKILFVCTGNSCRSVMAQGLLKDLLEKKGRRDVQVISAGVSTIGGLGPTWETVEVMGKQGIDVSKHVGQPVTPQLVKSADAVFCMEDFHRDLLLSQVPEAAEKMHLLKAFQAEEAVGDPNIPDPIGGPKEMYEACLLMIREAVERVAQWVAEG